MPRIGELRATDVWAAASRTLTAAADMSTAQKEAIWAVAARTLTGFSAEELFDLPIFDEDYPETQAASSASADTFGSWTQISADIGAGKRLIYATITVQSVNNAAFEVEFGEGGSGSEAAVARVTAKEMSRSDAGMKQVHTFPLWKALTSSARLSVRVKDEVASAITYHVHVQVA